MYSVTQLVKMIKSLTARQLIASCPGIKKQLWGGNIWTSGYYVNTVGQYASREVIQRYVDGQGKCRKLYEGQLEFEFGML